MSTSSSVELRGGEGELVLLLVLVQDVNLPNNYKRVYYYLLCCSCLMIHTLPSMQWLQIYEMLFLS